MQNQKYISIKYIVAVVTIILVIVGFIFAIKNSPRASLKTQGDNKVQVVASFYPLYFFGKGVGGDFADVVNITPTGGEPHDYEPSTQNIIQIDNSKLLLLNGGGLEAWGSKVAQIVNPKKTLVLTVGTDITTQMLNENGSNQIDPHIWLSPPLAKLIVDKIAAGFVQVDPTHAMYYEANAQALKAQLTTLDTEYQQGLSNCAKKDIVTSHSAFGYLASAYHLNQVSIAGLSPDAEPSPQQLVSIINLAKKDNVKYIFFESLTSPKLSQTIASEVGAQTLVLNPIEGLTPDEISNGKDYFTEMRANLANLQLALGCMK